MPTAEVKGCLVSVYHLAPQISEAFMIFLFAGANANKATSPDPSDWLCSVSLPISVFFTHSLHNVLARTRDSSKTPRPYSLCPKVRNTNGNLLSPNHLRSLPAAPHSDLSARQYKGVIPGYDVRTSAWQHVFRGCFRSYSATASLRHREGKLCGSCGRKTHPETVWSVC